MNEIYIVGLLYDDFDDGGFSNCYITHEYKKAKLELELLQSKYPTLEFEIRKYELNKLFHNG